MNAISQRDWRKDVQGVDIAVAAEALGIERKGSHYVFPHPGCDGVHSSGGLSVHRGRKTNRLHCRRCSGADARFDVCDVIAITLGYDHKHLDANQWARVREAAASHGWCLPDPKVRQVDTRLWERERAAADRQREERARLAEVERQAGAINVHAAWNALIQGRVGREVVRRWTIAREFPAGLSEHLPWTDLAGVPLQRPTRPYGVDPDGWSEAVRLMRSGYAIDRRVLIAQRDAEGRPIGASRRWHRGGAPHDDLAKSLALGARLCKAGAPGYWPGGVAIFGDLPMAVAKVRRGEPLFILEGGPDWVLASAVLRMAGKGAALATAGVSTMPKLAQAIRMALWMGPLPVHQPQIVILPDRDTSPKKPAANAARASEAELRAAANVEIRHTGCGDFGDFAKTTDADGVAHFLLGAA